MGRHSAPVDEQEELAATSSAPQTDPAAAISAGRHARPSGAPASAEPGVGHRDLASTGPVARIPTELPAELPAEQTRTIPAVDAAAAADTDEVAGPDLGQTPIADLEPIRPGEAIHLPSADSGKRVAGPKPFGSTLGRLRRARPKDSPPPTTVVVSADLVITASPDATAAPEIATPDTATPDTATPDTAKAGAVPKPRDGSAADLAILRSDSSLLARCMAAVLVPFLLYVLVMIVLGSSGRDWLIWIWVPAIVAGVMAGAFLDKAHSKRAAPLDPPVVTGS